MKLIPLSKGKAFAQVDDEDYDELMKYKWHVKPEKNTSYAVREELISKKPRKRKKIFMHSQLIGKELGKCVDHKDGNGLNNQRSNLRLCTLKENTYNRVSNVKGKFKGACYDKKNGIYYVAVVKDGVNYCVWGFNSEIEAAKYHDALAIKLHGEFARLNFPGEPLVDLDEAKPKSRLWRCGIKLRKLTEEQVLTIRERIANGDRQKDVARDYGISRSAVLRITKRETWSHI